MLESKGGVLDDTIGEVAITTDEDWGMTPKLSTNSSEPGGGDNDNGKIGIDIIDNAINDGYDGSIGKCNALEQKSVYSETDDDPTTNK